MDTILFMTIIATIFGIMFIIVRRSQNIMFKEAKIFAEKEGFVYNEIKGLFGISDDTNVTGNYKGFDFKLCLKREDNEEHNFFYIVMKLPVTTDCNFHIDAEGTSFLGRNIYIIDDIFVKREYFNTGDKEFDKYFKIKKSAPDYVCKILTPDIRQEMLNNKKLISQIIFNNNKIQYKIDGNFKVPEFKYVCELLYKLGENLCQTRENR